MAKQNGSGRERLGYIFSNGRKVKHGVTAKVVGEHLEALRKDSGGNLTPADVLKDARKGKSPLNKFFTWDDTEAANAHRIWQAQQLVASVKIVYRTSESGEPKEVRAFVSITEDKKNHYVSSVSLMTDAHKRTVAMQQALGELDAFRKRYAEFQEFFELFGVIDRTIKRASKAIEARAA